MSTSRIFGRDEIAHPYEATLQELEGGTLEEWALARNLRFDHRITLEREAELVKFVGTRIPTSAQLTSGVHEYFLLRVNERLRPDFVDPILNGRNILTRMGEQASRISTSVRLAQVLDLNGLLDKVFRWASEHTGTWKSVFGSYNPDAGIDEKETWLDRRLNGTAVRDQEYFVGSALVALAAYAVHQPYQPCWATLWGDFERHDTGEPEKWLELLGMTRPKGRWLVVLSYSVKEAGTVARPTQLDAGKYCLHHPSPPQCILTFGGHPVNLKSKGIAATLVSEYVHQQVPHTIAHWRAAGRRLAKTRDATAYDIRVQRTAHLTALEERYGSGYVRRWMPLP